MQIFFCKIAEPESLASKHGMDSIKK